MLKARQSLLQWLEPKLKGVSDTPILREPEDPWGGNCWRVTIMDERGATANGFWSRVVQIDRYRSDGDTSGVEGECQDLSESLGFLDNQEAQIPLPRNDYTTNPATQTGMMTLSLLQGSSWRRDPSVSVEQQGYRRYVLSLELVYQHD